MAKVTYVRRARKAIPEIGVKKGESYYWWKFRFGGIHRSKTQPKPSQLTQSTFLSTMLALQERLEALTTGLRDGSTTCSDAETELTDIASEVRSAGDECQSSFDNMPEGLQQGSTGELLTARTEACETIADELEGISVPDEEDETEVVNKADEDKDEEDANQNLRNDLADEIEGVEWSYE